MKTIILALIVAFIIPSVNAQYKSLQLTDTTTVTTKPKLKLHEKPSAGDELIGQFFGGNVGGIALGFGAGYVGYLLTKQGRGEMDGFGGALIGFVTGHCAGSIIGVQLGGSANKFSGDVGATILGGVMGTGAGFGYLYLVKGSSPASYFAAAFPTMGAMVGFNSTLRYKEVGDKKNVSELKDLGTHFKIKNDFEVNVIKLNFQLPNELELSKIPERFLLALK